MRTESTNRSKTKPSTVSPDGQPGSEALHTPGRQPIPASQGFNKLSQHGEQSGFGFKKKKS